MIPHTSANESPTTIAQPALGVRTNSRTTAPRPARSRRIEIRRGPVRTPDDREAGLFGSFAMGG